MSLIKKPSELEPRVSLSMLIYGQPGSGKSSLACSAPNAILFDYDGGVYRINGAHQVPTVQIRSWEDTNEALREVAGMPEVQTIIVDTVGKMLDFMASYIIKNNPKMKKGNGTLSLQGFGERKQMFLSFIKEISVMGKNVVFVAHEKEDKQGENTVKRPDVGGSSANDLIRDLDLVGYMRFAGKNRTISFTPEEEFYAKNSCNLPADIEVPTNLDENGNAIGKNNLLSGIIDMYKKDQIEKIKESKRFDELMEKASSAIEDVTNLDELNKICADIANMKHIRDSKIRLGLLLNKKASSIGAKLDKLKGVYVAA